VGAKKLRQKDYPAAVEFYKKALAVNQDVWNYWNSLGEAQFYLEEYDNAEHAFSEALRLKPNNSKTLYWLGWVYARKENYQKALEAFDESLLARPGNPQTLYWRALALESLQRYEDAESAYRKCIAVESRHSWAYTRIGNLCIGQGRTVDAVDIFYQGAIACPGDEDLCQGLIVSLHLFERLDKAEAFFGKRLENNPKDKLAAFSLGLTCMLKKEFDRSVKILNEVVPTLDYARNILYSITEFCIDNEEQETARVLCTNMVRWFPQDKPIWRLKNEMCSNLDAN